MICHYLALTEQMLSSQKASVLLRFDPNVELARSYFLKSIEQGAGAMEYFHYGSFLVSCGKKSEYIEVFMKTLKLSPHNLEAVEQLQFEFEAMGFTEGVNLLE